MVLSLTHPFYPCHYDSFISCPFSPLLSMSLIVQVSSSVFCSQDVERIGSWACLRSSGKASAFCTDSCCVRGACSKWFSFFWNMEIPFWLFSRNVFKFLVGIISSFFLTFYLVGFLLNGVLDSSWFSRWVICSQYVGLCLMKMKIEVRVGLLMKFCVVLPCEGLVRSPITATLPQISSRLFLTWGILWSFPEVKKILNCFIFVERI